MRAYMVYCGNPSEGAALVLARNTKEARRLGFSLVHEFTECEFIELRSRVLKDADLIYLAEVQRGMQSSSRCAPLAKNGVVDTLTLLCRDCEHWYPFRLDDGLCPDCFGEKELDRELTLMQAYL